MFLPYHVSLPHIIYVSVSDLFLARVRGEADPGGPSKLPKIFFHRKTVLCFRCFVTLHGLRNLSAQTFGPGQCARAATALEILYAASLGDCIKRCIPSVCPSVPCLRFYRNKITVETCHLVKMTMD